MRKAVKPPYRLTARKTYKCGVRQVNLPTWPNTQALSCKVDREHKDFPLEEESNRSPSSYRPTWGMSFLRACPPSRTKPFEQAPWKNENVSSSHRFPLKLTGDNHKTRAISANGSPSHLILVSRDPYIIHLNIATCKWWCPFILVEKATCFNWLQNGDLFRSPGQLPEKETRLALAAPSHRLAWPSRAEGAAAAQEHLQHLAESGTRALGDWPGSHHGSCRDGLPCPRKKGMAFWWVQCQGTLSQLQGFGP